MDERQKTALANPCRLAEETAHPRFAWLYSPFCSVVLTVNSGDE
jgi:hypothetical protein